MANTVAVFCRMIAAAIEPLLTAVDTGPVGVQLLGEELGWSLPDPPPPAFASLAPAVAAVLDALSDLDEAEIAGAGTGAVAAATARLVLATVTLADEVAALPQQLATQLSASYRAATQIEARIVDRLYGYLIVEALADRSPRVHAVMCLAGLIEDAIEPEDPPAFQPEYRRRELRWDRVSRLLGDPTEVVGELYGWRTQTIDVDRLYDALLRLGVSIVTPPTLVRPSDELLAVLAPAVDPDSDDVQPSIVFPFFDLAGGAITLALAITPVPVLDGAPQPLAFTLRATGLASFSIPLYPGARMVLETGTDLASGFGVLLRPGAPPSVFGSLDTGSAFESGRTIARFEYVGEDPIALLATGPDFGLHAESLFLSCGVEAQAGAVESFVDGGIEGASLVVRRGAVDGLLGALLPARGIEVGFALGARWSSHGLTLHGASAGLETTTAFGRSVGPFSIDTIGAKVTHSGGGVAAELTVSGHGRLGPLTVFIDRVGVAFAVALTPGNLGPVGVDLGFKPPAGGAVALSAAGLSGSALLVHDAATRRYAGVAHISGLGVSVAALGIVETGGESGFSGALIVSTTFSPVQLGLGFTLDGVGGMAGIQRRVDVEALRAAVRGTGMADLFFPGDLLAQAARLTGDLARYFPAAAGRHVFGPAVKLGWGTPTIITAEMAILLEVPSPIRLILLGTASAALPSQDHRIIDLNIDVVGEIDFSQKRLAIDASLRDSKVAGFPILGDLALRMHWGNPPSFALAVGGFHSEFPVPAGFPELRPIQIPIGSGDNPRFDVHGFLALTPNTAQVGAEASLYAAVGPLSITGNLGFEALIIFSPFSFQVDVWTGVALRRGDTVLASIQFDGRVSGPWPWRVDGEASLSLWFVDLRVPVHFSFGPSGTVELARRTIWPLLRPEIERAASWGTERPAGAQAVVTAPPVGEPPSPRVDPGASLALRQKVVPLDRRITHFGHEEPDGANEFRITEVRLGSTSVPTTPVTDWFAPAQFEAMSDADKLSRPGFERMTSGVAVGGDVFRGGGSLTRALEYETIVWADNQRQGAAPYRPSRAAQVAGTAISAIAQAPSRSSRAAAFAPPPGSAPMFTLQEESFVIASTRDLEPRWDLAGAVTRGQAELALRAHLIAAPGDAGTLQVVPAFEVAA